VNPNQTPPTASDGQAPDGAVLGVALSRGGHDGATEWEGFLGDEARDPQDAPREGHSDDE
jgi:hypothetical protein